MQKSPMEEQGVMASPDASPSPPYHAASRRSCAVKPGGLWLYSRGGRRQRCWVLSLSHPQLWQGSK